MTRVNPINTSAFFFIPSKLLFRPSFQQRHSRPPQAEESHITIQNKPWGDSRLRGNDSNKYVGYIIFSIGNTPQQFFLRSLSFLLSAIAA